MTLSLKLVFPLAIAAFYSSCSTISQTRENASHADSVVTRVIADGVVHSHIVRKDGPLNIHSLRIDLSRQDVDIVSARAFDSIKGRETTSSIARRSSNSMQTVLGAINADFFNMETGENDLNQVIEGEIVKGVKKPARAQFGLGESHTPYIERFVFDGIAIAPAVRFQVDGVNTTKDSGSIVALNRFVGSHTRKGEELVFLLNSIRREGDTLVTVLNDSVKAGERVAVGARQLLLRANGAKRRTLQQILIGDTVRLVLGFSPSRERLQVLVGGLPRLVVEGRNVTATDSLKGLTSKFTETLHPRTGVGFSRDSTVVYFVTVDGRQQASVGMSLSDFADLMIELGCYQALNLDGGGSTTMVVEDKIVNSPSDTSGERPVANVLLVVKRKKNAGAGN